MNDIRLRLTTLGIIPAPTNKDAVRAFQRTHALTADGLIGPKTIKAAIMVFQRQKGLTVDGIAGPKTLAALSIATTAVKPVAGVTIPSLAWMDIALSKIGLHEVTNNKTLADFLRSDGHALGDPAKLPWCGDFVETSLRLAIPGLKVPANPYWALNWATWGDKADPQYGAVLSFERTGGGHVGFYVGENSTSYLVLGGNQSNKVSKALVKKDQLRGSRLPPGYVGKIPAVRLSVAEGDAINSGQMQ
jgi:uncharacterized protein (TIGR02594 family)